MASLVAKKQGQRTYYYLVESARVGGEPRIFPEVAGELVARYRAIATDDQDLTVVFDAGQNSAGNFAHLADAGLQHDPG